MNDPDRLDRIEALIESNARAIEAISANTAEYQRDRARMYQFMSDLSQTMADLAQTQAESNKELAQSQAETKREMYRMLNNLDQRQGQLSQRQGEIVEILKLLVQPPNGSDTER